MRKADGRVHISDLKAIEASPAHYRWQIEHPCDDSPSMRMGRALHAYALQNVVPQFCEARRGTKAWESFVDAGHAPEEDILSASEFDTVLQMHDALERSVEAREILGRCPEREIGLQWDLFGLPCAGRVDARGPGILMDLKSCRAAYPKKFLWEAGNKLHYDAQMAWYDVAGGVVPNGPDTVWSEQYLIAVENVAPYNVMAYRLDPLRIDQGWQKVHRWMATLGACIKTGEWPGYLTGVQTWDGEIEFSTEEEGDDE